MTPAPARPVLAAQPLGLGLFISAVLLQTPMLYAVNLDIAAGLDPGESTVRLEPGTRWIHWPILWDAIKLQPWFGYGWNQIPSAHWAASANHPPSGEWIQHSHNLVLDLLVYNGLPFGFLLCALLIHGFVVRAKACRDSQSWSLTLALTMIFVHSLFEHPLHFAMWLLLAGLLMGVLSSPTAGFASRRWPRYALAAPGALLAGLLLLVIIEYSQADEAMRDQRLALAGIGASPEALPKHRWLLVDSWAAFLDVGTMTIRSPMPAEDLANLHRVAHRYPYGTVLFNFAQASAMNGSPQTARETLIHACKVYSVTVCEQMRHNWHYLQTTEATIRSIEFPVDRNPTTRGLTPSAARSLEP